jgi:hypothetical protein
MKTNPDPGHEDPLLEAVLRDEGWQAANAAGKAEALGVFQARQRFRRATRWACGLAALAVAVVFAMHWMSAPPAPQPPLLALRSPGPPPVKPERPIYLTDDELLALFPKGSCFLAEVDGKKKLVFLDPAMERQYVSEAEDTFPNHNLNP